MTGYILRRLLLMIPVLIIVAVIIFGLIHITPGDPAAVMAGEDATASQVEEMRERLGLNEPVHIQFFDWFVNALQLDFGDSIFLRQPVTEAMMERVQPTFLLTLYALTFAVMISIPAGVIAAVKRDSLIDRLLMVLSISGAAVPSFFFGIVLILLFAVILGWLPSGGYVDIGDDPIQHFKIMILPTVALGFSTAGLLSRMVRSTMLDVLKEDYVRTAYAKGLPNRHVVLGHALRNALIPAMTVLGISLAGLLGGSVVIETVFSLPGMGRLVVQSIGRRDFPVIQGVVLITAVIQLFVMLLIDILYVYVDPRVGTALSNTEHVLADAHLKPVSRFSLRSITPSSRYYWIRLVLENPFALVSLSFLVIVILLTSFASIVAPYDPDFVNPVDRLQSPSSNYWFGTDTLGRDVFSRTLHGGRISLLVGATVMLGTAIIGSIIGLVAGYYGKVDNVLMRVMDGFEAFPGVLLAIAIMASLGAATRNVIVALVIVFVPNVSRLVRSTTLVNKRQLYVESARAIGMRDVAIMRRYVFMNSLSPLIVQCTFIIALSILAEASLSFLGAGVPAGIPTWGNMVSEGQSYLQRAWWISVFPGTGLFLTVLAINLLGDGLRDALDPRSRER